ncbi:major facilitator superfamily domain-containing protein 6-like [Paramacrobiotus metropolitanus]|uniref:major facilitator superfamily domain-containing protein 6-like n=1 Tax=Paramacrobiotus metropolitanus TaxID=2943436 RepID=UPI002445DB5E|nr:major facilitator superfamily domain-containing protein 6-like [Paramacrobiotus metropolitanus]
MQCKVNTKLVPLKGLMFLVHGGISALLPFMAVHMRSLGITVPQTAIILAVLPFVSAVGPPLGGLIADKIGNYRLVFIVATVLSVTLHLLLYFVTPAYQPPLELSPNETFPVADLSFRCHANGSFGYDVSSLLGCPQKNKTAVDDFLAAMDVQHLRLGDCYADCAETNQLAPPQLDPAVCHGDKNDSAHFCSEQLKSRCKDIKSNCSFNCAIGQDFQAQRLKCPVPRPKVIGKATNDTGSQAATLGFYCLFRLTSTTIMWMAVPLLDSLAIALCQDHKADLGFQKMFSMIGFSLLPPLSGILIAKAEELNGFEDYGPAFYVFSAMHILAAIVVIFLRMQLRMPAQSLMKNILVVMADRRVISMTVIVFFCGCGFGFITSFLFWYMLEDLHSSKVLLGLSQTVCGLFGIPAMGLASKLIQRFGHTKLFIAGVVAYAIRFLGLSFVPVGQAYWVLPLQIFEGVSHSLVVVTAASYAAKLSPTFVASLQGIVFASHYCFGKGFGALISGFLMNAYGSRATFQIFAVFYICLAFLFYPLNFLLVTKPRRNAKRKAIEKGYDQDNSMVTGETPSKIGGNYPIYTGPSMKDEMAKMPFMDEFPDDGIYDRTEPDRQPLPVVPLLSGEEALYPDGGLRQSPPPYGEEGAAVHQRPNAPYLDEEPVLHHRPNGTVPTSEQE